MLNKLFYAVSILLVLWIFYSKMYPNSNTTNKVQQQFNKTQKYVSNLEKKIIERNKNLDFSQLSSKDRKIKNSRLTEISAKLLLESAKAKKEFEETALLKFEDKYREYEFTYLGEVDDGVIMMAGLDGRNDTSVRILAAPINPDINQAIAFIKENKEGLFKELSMESINNLKPYKQLNNINNFKNINVMSALDNNGNLNLVAMASRSDGKGTYLTVLSGPKEYIWNNEDKFEQFFSSFQAQKFTGMPKVNQPGN